MKHIVGQITNQVGVPVNGVTIVLKTAGTGTIATLYSDNGVTPITPPLLTTGQGDYSFYVADNRYDIYLTGSTITAKTLLDVEIKEVAGSVSDGQLSPNVALYNNGDKTWGAGSAFTWTFDGGANTDPNLLFTSGTNPSIATNSAFLVPAGTAANVAIGLSTNVNYGIRFATAQTGVVLVAAGADIASFSSTNGFYVVTVGIGLGTSVAGGADVKLTRSAAATLQMGAANSGAPVAQTLQSQGATGTNIAGSLFTLRSGTGTGFAKPSLLTLSGPIYGVTGSAVQTVIKRLVNNHCSAKVIANNTATTVVTSAAANSSSIGVIIRYTVNCSDATDTQSETGIITVNAVANSAGTQTLAAVVKSSNAQTVSTGTLAVTWTSVTNGATVDIKVTSNSSLTPTTHTVVMEVLNLSAINDITLV
jgi:hypothetical protein